VKLGELSKASGVSRASIKFYLREGLLAPGRKKNATLAHYTPRHLDRLRLIAALRDVVGASLPQIRALTELIDDPEVPLPRVLERAQLTGLGEPAGGAEGSPAAGRRVDEIIAGRNWPDLPSEARKAVARHLDAMSALGLGVSDGLIEAYVRAAEIAAAAEINRSVSENRDAAALTVAVGVHSHTQLLLRTVALAQASLTLRHFGESGAPGAEAGE